MFGQKSTRQIDLHLPTGWNRCTTEELEAIAAAIIQEQQRVDRYHPFDWQRVKLNVVLAVNSIEVVSQPVPVIKNYSHDDTYLVRRSKDEESWPITVGQLVARTERLAWIDDEKASKVIFQFPYPTLDVRCKKEDGRAISHQTSAIIHLQGPPPLLDGYTWQEYRWMTDWMQAYMRYSNAKNAEGAAQAQREFLAVLFKPCEKSQGVVAAEHTSSISHHPSDIFEGFSPIKWQVILFWWSSLMSMLAKKFPKVFKSQPVGKGKRRPQQQDTPWDFYNRVTAIIQKYIGGLSEQDVNNATYGTILQQLETMADEAAEMEKLKRKK
jgi:hypothetical protein